MLNRVLAPCVACLFLAPVALQAQVNPAVFVLPGANASSALVTAFGINPLSRVTAFQSGTGSYLLFAKPDNSRFYVVATSVSQSVTSVDNTFQTPHNILALSQPITAAAMTPDGTRLAVADGGTVHIIDTTSDTDILSNGLSVGNGVKVFDVAVSLDGTRFFTLGTTPSGSQLNAIDVASTTVVGTLAIPGTATAVAVGPNDLVYVSTQGLVDEVDPNALKVTPGGSISMSATPGRLVFTPDGQYALTPNQTPSNGPAALLIALANHAVVNTVPSFGIILTSFQVIGTNRILGYSNQSEDAYLFTIQSSSNIQVSNVNIPNSTSSATTALAVSNEVPAGTISSVKSVFAINSGILYQLDPTSFVAKGQLPLTDGINAGAVAYSASAVTVGTPTTVLQYGGGQTVATNSNSRPIVVQVLDSLNRPLAGANVTFSTTSKTSTLSSTTVITQDNGYALTYLNAGSVTGSVQVNATAGSKTVGFTLNVGASSTGSVGTISIVAGQGEVFEGGDSTLDPGGTALSVLVKDANGAPLPGAPVTFRVALGTGTVFTSSGGGASVTVESDGNGIASCDYSSTLVTDQVNQYSQSQVTASAPGTTSVTFYLTALIRSGGIGLTLLVRQNQPMPGEVLTGAAGSILPGAVQIQVASLSGVPIPNISVTLSSGGLDPTRFPSATCSDPTGKGVVSNANGLITCDVLLGPVIGTATVQAVVGVKATLPAFTIKVTPGAPGIVNILQGNNQSGLPGQILPLALKVHVTDSSGNTLPSQPVHWQVLPAGSVTLTNVLTMTDFSGNASATATLGSAAGAFQVQVTAGSVSATFNVSATVPSSGIASISGDGQTAVVNTAFDAPLVVKVVDASNNGVQGVQVNFQVASGTATLGTATATTDASGQASTTVQAGSTPGTITVTATSNTFSVTFTLTARPPGPTNLAIVNGASFDKNTGISPGSIAIITGTGILPGVEGLIQANNIVGPLPTTLPATNGASVAFGDSLILAPIYYVMNSNGAEQIAVQVPFEISPGPLTITVTAAGGGSATLTATVQPFAPGVFETQVGNQSFAVALRSDGSFVTSTNPAQRGEDITVYVTGLGAVSPAAPTGAAGIPGGSQTVQAPMIVGLNNSGAPLVSAVYAPGMVGVYAVTLHVPEGTTPGPAQPLGMIVFDPGNNNKAYFGQAVYLPIQ